MNIIILILIIFFVLAIILGIEGHTIIPNQELNDHLDEYGFEKEDENIILDNLEAQDIADLVTIAEEIRTEGVAGGLIEALDWGFGTVLDSSYSDSQGLVDFISEDHACEPSYSEGCRVSLKDNTTVSRHANDLFNKGFANFSEYSMVPEAYIAHSAICDSGNHCGSDGKPHADVIQFFLSVAQQRYENNLNLWKEHHDICYKDWATGCDNVGFSCKAYIDDEAIENPATHDYTNPGEFKCYHYSLGAGFLPPGSPRCDEYLVACPYEYQCRQYSDRFPKDCEGHLSKDDIDDYYHYDEAMSNTQEALCRKYDGNERGCLNHNDDRESNSIEYHNDVDHRHQCKWDSENNNCCRRIRAHHDRGFCPR